MAAPTQEPTITMRTAHDVRHLRACANCGRMGDDRHMPLVAGQLMHGFCALNVLGLNGVLALPKREIGKITLEEIGPRAMKRLVNR